MVFYSPQGRVIKAFELADLFSQSEIKAFQHSVSSIAWRKSAGSDIRADGDTFNVTVNDQGAGFIFELTGAYQYCETRAGVFVCRTANRGRIWRGFREPSTGQH